MLVTLLLAQLFAALTVSQGATITLYDIAPSGASYFDGPSAAEYTIKPIGTDTNGDVTYLEHEVVTAWLSASVNPTATGQPQISFVTQTIPTLTREDTIVQGPSKWAVNIQPTAAPFDAGENRTCTGDPKGDIVCVEVLWGHNEGSTEFETLTHTFTGTLKPVYTFVTNDGQLTKGLGGGSTVLRLFVLLLATGLGAFITLF